jgi:hypothetical protein
VLWRGSSAGQGGFFWMATFAIGANSASDRVMVGLQNAPTTWTTGDPSAFTDTIYFGVDSAGDANFDICGNDNAGSAVCTDLGANFPARTTGAYYTAYLWATPNASQINYALKRWDSAQFTSGNISVAGNLPRNTVALTNVVKVNTGPSLTTAVAVDLISTCVVAKP